MTADSTESSTKEQGLLPHRRRLVAQQDARGEAEGENRLDPAPPEMAGMPLRGRTPIALELPPTQRGHPIAEVAPLPVRHGEAPRLRTSGVRQRNGYLTIHRRIGHVRELNAEVRVKRW